MSEIVIYKSPGSKVEIDVTFENETVWLTQYQLAELFNTDRTSILKHLQNIYATKELKENATCAKFAQVRKELYPTLEEKAAALLYLIVKNHSFVDGNKRIAAACFLYFLQSNKRLFMKNGTPAIHNDALAAITIFTASSKSNEMETVKRFIISVLNRNAEIIQTEMTPVRPEILL